MNNCTRSPWREADFEVNMLNKSKKHLSLGALLDVQMLQECTPWWRQAHLARNTFGSQHVKSTAALWREACFYVNCAKRTLVGVARGIAFWPAFRFAKMILRDRCSISLDLASLFRGMRSLHRWRGKITKRIGTCEALSSALSFPFLKEVSQSFCIFDVVNFQI